MPESARSSFWPLPVPSVPSRPPSPSAATEMSRGGTRPSMAARRSSVPCPTATFMPSSPIWRSRVDVPLSNWPCSRRRRAARCRHKSTILLPDCPVYSSIPSPWIVRPLWSNESCPRRPSSRPKFPRSFPQRRLKPRHGSSQP